MERLTTKFVNGYLFKLPPESDEKAQKEYVDNLADKLGEYEDLEEQGLLLRLPCKVGDMVWAYLRAWNPKDGIAPYQITNITITQNKKGIWTKKYRAMWLVDGKTRAHALDFSFDDIGKTIFLTKEEAEAALEKMKGGAG